MTRAIASDTATAAAVARVSSVAPPARNRRTANANNAIAHDNMTVTPRPPTRHRRRSRSACSAVFRVNTKSEPRLPFPSRTRWSRYVVLSTTLDFGPTRNVGRPPSVISGGSKNARTVMPSSTPFPLRSFAVTRLASPARLFFVSSSTTAAFSSTSSAVRGTKVPLRTTSPGMRPRTRNATRFTTTLGS